MGSGYLIRANAWGGAWGYSWWGAWGNAWGGWTVEVPLEYHGGGGARRRAPPAYRGRRLDDGADLERVVRAQWELLETRLRNQAPATPAALSAALVAAPMVLSAGPGPAEATTGLNMLGPAISAPADEDDYDALALLLLST